MNEYSTKIPSRKLPTATLALIFLIIIAFSVWNALSGSAPMLLALIIQAPLFALAFSSDRRPYIPIAAVALFILSLALSRDIASALIGAMYLPIGLSVAICAIKKKSFSFTLAASSAVFIVYYAICVAVTLYFVYDGLNMAVITEYFEVIKQMFYSVFEQSGLDASVINQLAVTFFAFIPSGIAVCSMAIVAIVLSAYKRAIKIFDLDIDLPDKWALSLSSASAVIYLISCMLYLVLGSLLGEVISVAFGNLFMILTPLFAILGFKKGYAQVKEARASGRFPGIIIFAIIMFFFNPYYLAVFLGIYGAFSAFPAKKFNRIDPGDTDNTDNQ